MAKEELELFLKWTAEGNLVEVERLIQKNANLVYERGSVVDRSGREFKNITGLQYAVWAFDLEMCALIQKYLDKNNVALQVKALETEPNEYSSHGVHYDITSLIAAKQTYLNNYAKWEGNEKQRYEYWQKEVGGAQRQCPAWLIYTWIEEGENTAWIKQDFVNYQVIRQYNKNLLDWWFTYDYNDGKGVGSSWAAERGGAIYIGLVPYFAGPKSKHDIENLLKLKSAYLELMNNFKEQAFLAVEPFPEYSKASSKENKNPSTRSTKSLLIKLEDIQLIDELSRSSYCFNLVRENGSTLTIECTQSKHSSKQQTLNLNKLQKKLKVFLKEHSLADSIDLNEDENNPILKVESKDSTAIDIILDWLVQITDKLKDRPLQGQKNDYPAFFAWPLKDAKSDTEENMMVLECRLQ